MDCIDSTLRVTAFRPLSAASSVLMPFDIESRRLLRSPARACSETDVKKFDGLSRAELTFLPVARRFCVVPSRDAVFCRASRFWRTPAERVMLLAIDVNLSGLTAAAAEAVGIEDADCSCRSWQSRRQIVTRRKKT